MIKVFFFLLFSCFFYRNAYSKKIQKSKSRIVNRSNLLIEKNFIFNKTVKLYTEFFKNINYKSDKVCLLVSGAGASALFWSNNFCKSLMKHGYSVIRFDHRDTGLSDSINWKNNPYTIEDLCTDVIAILNFYKFSKVHVVGHSMGGRVVQWMAANYPQYLKSYTSISVATTGEKFSPSSGKTMQILMKNKPTQNFQNDLEGFMKSWKILHGNYPINYYKAKIYTKDLYIRSKHKVDVAWNHIHCQEKYMDLSVQLKKIRIPGLFIHGEKDPLISLKGSIQTHKLATNSKIVIIKDMGHMFFNKNLESQIIKLLVHHFEEVI